jgi:hypothetical protein
MQFNVEYPSQIEKGLVALRTVIAEPDLRELLRLGRRSGAPLDRLLREILELSLLRKAADGKLEAGQAFSVTAEFDAGRSAACFVSVPSRDRPDQPDGAATRILESIRGRELQVIEWDHRALGGRIHLTRPAMEVGIGYDGLESFTLIAGIGRENPDAVARALAPLLSSSPATLPVG